MTGYIKPLPQPDATTEAFWKSAKRHELVIQCCRDCHEHVFYPGEVCPIAFPLIWKGDSGLAPVDIEWGVIGYDFGLRGERLSQVFGQGKHTPVGHPVIKLQSA